MNAKKTTTGRKATTRAANAAKTTRRTAAKTATAHTDSKAQREQARVARWKEHAEKIVGKMNDDDRAILDAAAEAVNLRPVAFLLDAMKEERGLGKRNDCETEINLKVDEDYEAMPTRTRNKHELDEVRAVSFFYTHNHVAGLTHAEKVEVVRRYFRKGDRHLAEAEGRAIKAALAMPPPAGMNRAEIEAQPLGEDPATAYAPTATEIGATVDAAASKAAKVYGEDPALASMFAAATVEENDDPAEHGVFVMANAPDFTHAGMFATALAAEIFPAGHVMTEATPYGEMKAEDGDGYVVSWYIENRRHVSTAHRARKA